MKSFKPGSKDENLEENEAMTDKLFFTLTTNLLHMNSPYGGLQIRIAHKEI